jgi:hypothetical protein
VNESRILEILLIGLLTRILPGCGGGEPPEADMARSAEIGCANDERAQPYLPDMELRGESGPLRFRLIAADPAPPARGENTWVIQLVDVEGEVVDDAALEALPFMPDHGHGSTRVASASRGDDGYELSPLVFFMPGLWRVRLDAQTDLGDDAAEFFFCIEG